MKRGSIRSKQSLYLGSGKEYEFELFAQVLLNKAPNKNITKNERNLYLRVKNQRNLIKVIIYPNTNISTYICLLVLRCRPIFRFGLAVYGYLLAQCQNCTYRQIRLTDEIMIL